MHRYSIVILKLNNSWDGCDVFAHFFGSITVCTPSKKFLHDCIEQDDNKNLYLFGCQKHVFVKKN